MGLLGANEGRSLGSEDLLGINEGRPLGSEDTLGANEGRLLAIDAFAVGSFEALPSTIVAAATPADSIRLPDGSPKGLIEGKVESRKEHSNITIDIGVDVDDFDFDDFDSGSSALEDFNSCPCFNFLEALSLLKYSNKKSKSFLNNSLLFLE